MSTRRSETELHAIMAQVRWRVREESFVVAGLEPRERLLVLQLLPGVAGSFVQFIVEPDMLTLVLTEADWRIMGPAFPHARIQRPYRVITFDLDLPADLVGFLAAITTALAGAGVPLLAVCGYSKDHVMVRDEHLEAALAAIEALIAAPFRE